MYAEQILELYKHPLNYGPLKQKTLSARLVNPLCGDDISIDVRLKDRRVCEISFYGESCAICRASASLLTEYAKGKSLIDLLKLNADAMKEIIGIDVSPGRINCLLLPLEVIKKIA